MTHHDKMIEALARAIHCHDGRLPTPWDADMIARWPDDCEYELKVAMSQAAAVLDLVGPKPLVWHSPCAGLYRADAPFGLYEVIFAEETSMCFRVAGGVFHRLRVIGDTLEAAQAAAQAHADAEHWKNTKIGGSLA